MKIFLKKKLVFYFVILNLFQHFCIAQNKKMDSLLIILKTAKEDTNKVNTLIEICKQNGMIDDDKKKIYSENALQLATTLNFRKGMIMSRISVAVCSNNMGNYDKALTYVNEALNMALENPNDKRTLADIYNIIGISYYYKGDFVSALPNFLKSAPLYETVGKKGRVANVEYNMALIYFENKEYKKAIEYTEKVIAIYDQLKENVMMANALTQLGNIYVAVKNYEMALKYFKESLELTENIEDKSYSMANFNGIGNILSNTQKYSEALTYHKKTFELAKASNDLRSMVSSYQNMGSDYFKLGKISESIDCLNQTVSLSKKIGTKNLTSNAYSFLSKIYESQNDFKEALKYKILYTELSDSIYNKENAIQINGLAAKYESEKKEKEIAQLNLDVLTKQKKVEEKNIIMYSTLISSALLLALIVVLFNRQQLKQKNNYQIELSKQQEANAIAIVQAQENERNSIAKDLHDGVGTFLSTLKLNVQGLENAVSIDKQPSYKNALQLIDTTAIELRNVMKNLSNETLKEQGLVGALTELVERVNRLGTTKIDFKHFGVSSRLENIIEVNLYRVAQELISNCIKHAKATQATLQLIDHETSVLLMLEDNGKGFKRENTPNNSDSGMGLKNISNRVAFIKGTFKVESASEQGTTLIIETPKNIV